MVDGPRPALPATASILKTSSLVLGKILSQGVSGWLIVNSPWNLSFLDARASRREVIVGVYDETTKSETLFPLSV